jgi:CheY-like chemotaxis protein
MTREEAAIRVLVADDVLEYRQLVRALLEQDPLFKVIGEAGNGIETLEIACRKRPDLVLLDMAMPVLDGLKTIPKLIARCPDTEVVVLSGFAPDAAPARRALELGASAYLDKGKGILRLVDTLLEVSSAARRKRR